MCGPSWIYPKGNVCLLELENGLDIFFALHLFLCATLKLVAAVTKSNALDQDT